MTQESISKQFFSKHPEKYMQSLYILVIAPHWSNANYLPHVGRL